MQDPLAVSVILYPCIYFQNLMKEFNMITPTSLPPQLGRPSRLYNIFNKAIDELILANTTIHHALRTLRFTKASSSSNLRNTARYERYSCEGYYARFAD